MIKHCYFPKNILLNVVSQLDLQFKTKICKILLLTQFALLPTLKMCIKSVFKKNQEMNKL